MAGREAALVARHDRNAALAAAYREGLGLAAVAIVTGPERVRLATTDHGGAPALAPGEQIAARWWCRRAAEAEYLASAVRPRRRTADTTADDIARTRDAVLRAAGRLALVLLTDADIEQAALRVRARLDQEIVLQQKAGALKSVNKAYRDYRLEAAARGERVLPYARWMERYKLDRIRDIAAHLR